MLLWMPDGPKRLGQYHIEPNMIFRFTRLSYVWGCSETGALGNGGFVHPKKPKVKGEFSQRAQRAKKLKAPDPVPVVSSPYRCYQPDFYNLNISHVAAGHGFSLWVNSNNKSKLPRGERH